MSDESDEGDRAVLASMTAPFASSEISIYYEDYAGPILEINYPEIGSMRICFNGNPKQLRNFLQAALEELRRYC